MDVVVDTGDSTDLGTPAESRYVEAIGRLDVPYVWIRGNHDSRAVQAAVARQPNATVLDGPQVVEVAGVRMLGQGDPRFISDAATRGEAPPEVLELVGEQLREAYDDAADKPDLVLTHDPATAGPLMGGPPVVLAGHTHRRRTQTADGTTLLVQGSTGGAGLRALRGEGRLPSRCRCSTWTPRPRSRTPSTTSSSAGSGERRAHQPAGRRRAAEGRADADYQRLTLPGPGGGAVRYALRRPRRPDGGGTLSGHRQGAVPIV